MHRSGLFSFVLFCLLVAGCSATQFAYNRLDWFTVWRLDRLFELDDTQRDELRGAVNRTFAWHRETQLPRYTAFLRQLDRDLASPLSADLLDQRYEQTLVFWDDMLNQFMPEATAFLRGLSAEQVENFIANAEDDNEELWEEFGGQTAEQRLERRSRAAVKGFERFTGRFNGEQKELVSAYIATMHDNAEEWLEGRRRWQLEFRNLLRESPEVAEYQRRLTDLMVNPNQTDSAEYRQKVDDNRRIVYAMVIDVMNSLTKKQRARLSSRLNNFADDFEQLRGQST